MKVLMLVVKSRALWIVLARKRGTKFQEEFQDNESLQIKVIMRDGAAKISSNVTYLLYGKTDWPWPPQVEWEPIGFVPLQNYEVANQ